jgi:hypothetical protein
MGRKDGIIMNEMRGEGGMSGKCGPVPWFLEMFSKNGRTMVWVKGEELVMNADVFIFQSKKMVRGEKECFHCVMPVPGDFGMMEKMIEGEMGMILEHLPFFRCGDCLKDKLNRIMIIIRIVGCGRRRRRRKYDDPVADDFMDPG